MSNNQNTGQFMVKQQIGKHSTEGGSFPPRYQAPPHPLSDVSKSANVNFPTRDYKGAYNARVPSDQLKHGYPGPISASVPANLQYNAALQQPFSKHGHNGYPASVSGHRQYRLSDDNLSKAGAHQEAPQRARSVEDEILRAPQQLLKGRPTDEELLRRGPTDMLKFVKRLEGETARSTNEQQRQIQSLIDEIKALKEANRRLNEDNRELRDLCCFLDDDRQKGRKLAREWQRFGRYTASVMRQEVSAYQSKLRELDDKQQELIKDNLELKELCLYLDEERGASRNGGGGLRDDGDGSSSSTNADDPLPRRAAFDDRTVRYVRDLEARVERLEEEKRALLDGGGTGVTEGMPGPGSARPEAVVRALQVLEVRERARADLDAGEKALVREMCNVVWRKLEEAPPDDRC